LLIPRSATSSAPQGGGGPDEQEASGAADASGAPLPQDQSQPQQDRSLGDIMQEIRRRRDEILNQAEREEVSDKPEAQEQAPGQVEYLHDGQEDENSTQALGAAQDEQQKLEDLKIVDDEDEQENAPPPAMEDDDEDPDAAERAAPPASEPDSRIQGTKEDGEQPQGAEKALTQSDIVGNAPSAADGMNVDDELEGDEPATEAKPDEAMDEDGDIDLQLTTPGAADEADGAEDLWRQYASLTSDLSYALCEQLRLILEPTLATRLQGDFRTGKRLNMRKIIPYIASEYTKDKIWLRRTKPSRREYQVLLSLDDSRSMAESHSVHLAYQTLALVSQALTKLEVGQVSIARFGEGVDILHEFGESFSDADGAKVMRAFKFDQHRTDVVALVERTLAYLAESRQKQAGASAPDLWQLQIIISDGVCQDHNKLRTLLRRAIEERVMIVFLIVDSLAIPPGGAGAQTPVPVPTPAPSAPTSGATTPAAAPQHRPSILSMQSVNYTMVNGEMKLEMARYLDTFPFEFYVVLRDVEALPSVLSDTLRQWMARVSQSNE
jgi:midasin